MWRRVCSILLLVATAQTQDRVSTADAKSGPNAAATVPRIQVKHYYTQLRRGTTEDVAVLLLVGKDFVTTPTSPVADIAPVSLELQPTEALRVSKLHYPKAYPIKFAFKAAPLPVRSGLLRFPIRFKLHAERNAPLGEHLLVGRISYQTVNAKGVSSPQQVELQVPVNVVDHRAHVAKEKDWPFDHHSAGLIVLTIVVSPILIPFFLICAATNC